MKAVRLIEPGKPLEMQEIPTPELGAEDVLVRVMAAGICHSDAHYRAGVSPVRPLPLTLGHEVAGIVESAGTAVKNFNTGDRVCLHYLVTCGKCEYCHRGSEQFCVNGSMIGKYRDGGYAEFIRIPERSLFHLPASIPFEQGAIMMCSSATSYHALCKARLQPGETIAVFGVGGLGMSAIQIAQAVGAKRVFAVDINPSKLEFTHEHGAIAIDAREGDPITQIKALNGGEGVDVALELIGLPVTMRQAVESVGVFGRVALVGLSENTIEIDPYNELLMREAELIGVADHLARELPALIHFVEAGDVDLSSVITRTIPLDAVMINETFDALDDYEDIGRVVIMPEAA
ncbi:MAG: zinc-binding dehydrogenase [Anaerolineales bacterium]|jgi:propanol-preferring alcohol dehydrogenase